MIKNARNMFVTLLTIRGVRHLADFKSDINTAPGHRGLSIAPRVLTEDDGMLLNYYVYDDPHASEVIGADTLVSYRNGDDGIALGVSPTKKGKSGRMKAYSGIYKRGGGDEIATSISMF